MLRTSFDLPADGTVLCLGAHCDDIEIGCGGLMLHLLARHPKLRFEWVLFSGDDVRERETRAAAAGLMGPSANLTVDVRKFRGSYFPHSGPAIKDAFEAIRTRIKPDLILTHYLTDRHQDHRVISELTWNTFRSHTILEYEIPKYEGDLAHPSVYCPVPEAAANKKITTLMEHFASQRNHQWFDAELFRGHMRLRGVECNSPTRYAEAFHARKLVL